MCFPRLVSDVGASCFLKSDQRVTMNKLEFTTDT